MTNVTRHIALADNLLKDLGLTQVSRAEAWQRIKLMLTHITLLRTITTTVLLFSSSLSCRSSSLPRYVISGAPAESGRWLKLYATRDRSSVLVSVSRDGCPSCQFLA